MKRILGLVVVAALALSYSFAPARADDALDAQLKATYDAQCAAIKNGDFDGYAKLLTLDFTNLDPDGTKQNRDQDLAQVKQALSGIQVSTCHFTFVTAERSGNTATASVVASFEGTTQGEPLTVVTRETDTFAQKGDAWLQSGAVVAEQTITVAGKVFQHSGTPPSPSP